MIRILLGEHGAESYDRLVHGGARQVGEEITVAIKAGAMKSGRSAVVVAFQSLVDGKVVNVQATVSLREFAGVAGAVIAVERKELETHPG